MTTAKSILRSAYGATWQTWERLTYRPTGRYPLVHQGIQRSGTNFLFTVLEAGEYRVLNRIDPARNNPRHKHFRWQADKDTIVMDPRYRNRLVAETVHDINRICRYPDEMRHLVLFRPPRDWIDAIFRWGISNTWFPSEEAFLDRDLHRAFLREWHAYYAAWAGFAARDPGQVMMLSYADLRDSREATLARIDAFMGVQRDTPVSFGGGGGKVRHSRPMTEARTGLTRPEIDAAVAEGGAFDWTACSLHDLPLTEDARKEHAS